MRISDWSSDVCSSDLHVGQPDLIDLIFLHQHLLVEALAIADTKAVVGQVDRLAVGIDIDELNREVGVLRRRSEEHTSELQSLMRISYAVFCLKKKIKTKKYNQQNPHCNNHDQ